MDYHELGRTGVKVSAICLGTMTFGQQNAEAEGHAQMDYAVDRGITIFDAAELYPIPPKPQTQGRTEAIIGGSDDIGGDEGTRGDEGKCHDGCLLKLSDAVLRDIEQLHLTYPNPCP